MEDQRDILILLGVKSSYIKRKMDIQKLTLNLKNETVWLTQAQLCELYQTSKSNISEHIKHIFEEEELDEESVVRKFRTTASHQLKAAAHHRGAAAGCQS